LGSILLLAVAFALIFFIARGCVATQESTQVRKYVTNADSLLSESSNSGNKDLQSILQRAGGNPAKRSERALDQAATESEDLYVRALTYEEIPPEFEDAHHYLVTSLGIRARAAERLAQAATADAEDFTGVLEDYRLSDAIVRNHYLPAVQDGLIEAGQQRDQVYLEEPEPFMDYEELDFAGAAPMAGTAGSDPNVLHGVEIAAVEVAGQPLYPGGNVVLTGSDEPIFLVTVKNGGETPETGVDVEVILNTRAERQAQTATTGHMQAKGRATVNVGGFRPGELDETAEVTVEAGPVEYEQFLENNTLTGTVTFGL
jgi:hypothetical protein